MVGVEESRCHFAEVDGHDLAAVAQVGDDEAAAAEIAGFGECHRQRERRGDCSIDGVTTAVEDLAAGVGGVPFTGDDGMFGECVGVGAGLLGESRDRKHGQKDDDSRRASDRDVHECGPPDAETAQGFGPTSRTFEGRKRCAS